MKGLLSLLILAVSISTAACSHAGRLTNTFTWPAFEALAAGPDTCAADTVREAGPLTAVRTWTGPQSGSDQLTNGQPGTVAFMSAGVPNGTYAVSVVVRDAASNQSCAATGTFVVKGKPARIQNLSGWRTEQEMRLLLRTIWMDAIRGPVADDFQNLPTLRIEVGSVVTRL